MFADPSSVGIARAPSRTRTGEDSGIDVRCASGLYRASASILLVDDRDADADRITRALACCRDLRLEVDHVSDPAHARRLWDTGCHDLALFDFWLGNTTSMKLLAQLAAEAGHRPIIVLSNLPAAEARAFSGAGCDLMVHSKRDLSSTGLGITLGTALALARHEAVTFAD